MKRDAFSRCHPAVNFLFFAGAIGAAVATVSVSVTVAILDFVYVMYHFRKEK